MRCPEGGPNATAARSGGPGGGGVGNIDAVGDPRERALASRAMRATLAGVTSGAALEASLQMLSGMVTHSFLMHGVAPGDDVMDAAVDIVLQGVSRR